MDTLIGFHDDDRAIGLVDAELRAEPFELRFVSTRETEGSDIRYFHRLTRQRGL